MTSAIEQSFQQDIPASPVLSIIN